ncbi:MAG: aspartate 1-decarboxylase [Calditrichaeota bacterium]|nr:aspartate 1-decarboxylase [Calditrichota bacterium]RQW05975.1 MAG: aspartate 1-decarboxylase [Calditrichota bacterium]
MLREFLKSKIHRATVTQSNLHYSGSLTIDEDLLDKSGILPNEHIRVYNIHTGQRFETYVIKGERGSGEIVLNGAAARKGAPGDLLIIVAYCYLSEEEISSHSARIVILGKDNVVEEVIDSPNVSKK